MADMRPPTGSELSFSSELAVPPGRASKANERELIALRQKLEAVQRTRADFLMKMSHEFRTPMTAIVGMTDLLLLGQLSAEQRECLSAVRDAADNLMELLNAICDHARVEAGLLDFEWSGFRLRGLVEDVVRQVAVSAREKDVEIVVRVASAVPDLLVADPHRLQQVLYHMLDSSVRLTGRGRVSLDVEVESELADELNLRFVVCDTGSGIALEDQQRILQPFLGTDAGLKKRYSLSPMGLPLVATLVAAMGGKLQLTSDLGSGSCFDATVRLLKQNRLGQTPVAPDCTRLRGKCALVVDPSTVSSGALAEQLRRWRMEVVEAADVNMAVQSLLQRGAQGAPVDVVLYDAISISDDELRQSYRAAGGSHELKLVPMYPVEHEAVTDEPSEGPIAVRKPIFNYQLCEALASVLQVGELAAQDEAAMPREAVVERKRRRRVDAASIARCEVEAAVGRLGGDVELYKELVQCFLDDTSDLLPKLRGAVDQRDADGLHRAGHSLKGLAASCGAQGVAEAAGRLERMGREKKLGEVDAALAALERTMAATREELAEYYPAG